MRIAADRPPEQRGLARDGVRQLVVTPDGLAHSTFRDLGRFLATGDLLVINTSATVPAAVDGRRFDGLPVTVHFSTPLDDGTWVAELREPPPALARVRNAAAGETIALPAAVSATLLQRYPDPGADRLWTVRLAASGPVGDYLTRHGRPIRYSYVPHPIPLAAYQNVFAREAGSAEMPSAGRPFTAELITSLVAAGVVIAPLTLHTGVASLEAGEEPLPERFAVPAPTARLVNLTRTAGGLVVAVGTTVTRALEGAADDAGTVRPGSGWTDIVLGPDRPARVVTGLITGWHDPEASHLALLQAVAGPTLVAAAYEEADKQGYLGHEFGDSCLLLP